MPTTPLRRHARAIGVGAVALAFAVPLAFLVAGSLREPFAGVADGFEWLPSPLRTANYGDALRDVPGWASQVRNTLLVIVLAVPTTVLVGSWAGFALVSAAPRARRWLFGATLLALLVPPGALWVPRVVLYRELGLHDSLLALALPALAGTTPFFVLLFALSYWRVPRDLFDAARLDGLGPWGVWRRVAWPLGRPATFAVAVLAFAFYWSDFTGPLLHVSDPELATVGVGVARLAVDEPARLPLLLAGSLLASLPPAIAFLLAQRGFFRKAVAV